MQKYDWLLLLLLKSPESCREYPELLRQTQKHRRRGQRHRRRTSTRSSGLESGQPANEDRSPTKHRDKHKLKQLSSLIIGVTNPMNESHFDCFWNGFIPGNPCSFPLRQSSVETTQAPICGFHPRHTKAGGGGAPAGPVLKNSFEKAPVVTLVACN